MRAVFTFCATAIAFFFTATAIAQSPNPDLVRQSTVYIFFEAVDPNTGAKEKVQGTGFVVSPKGHVLTASHTFRKWRNQRDVDKSQNPIKGTLWDKPGYTKSPELILSFIKSGEEEDVALLKLPELDARYPTAPICFQSASKAALGDQLSAYGFPQNQSFQPVLAILGNQNAPGGRWAATSAFTYGMSGGPVYKGDVVIGLVKGGLENTNAVQWITPIEHAVNFLAIAGLVEKCKSPTPMAVSTRRLPALAPLPAPTLARKVGVFDLDQLSWSDIPGATEYVLEKSFFGFSPTTQAKEVHRVRVNDLAWNLGSRTTYFLFCSSDGSILYNPSACLLDEALATYYRVKAIAGPGRLDSSWSNVVSVEPRPKPKPLPAPTLARKVGVFDLDQLSWSDIPGATEYVLEKSFFGFSQPNSQAKEVHRVRVNDLAWDLGSRTTYFLFCSSDGSILYNPSACLLDEILVTYYRVKAIAGPGRLDSSWSNVVSVEPRPKK